MKDDVKPWDLLNPNKPRSESELKEARLSICRDCAHWRPRTGRCGKCGCIMQLKTSLKNAKCPIGKW